MRRSDVTIKVQLMKEEAAMSGKGQDGLRGAQGTSKMEQGSESGATIKTPWVQTVRMPFGLRVSR